MQPAVFINSYFGEIICFEVDLSVASRWDNISCECFVGMMKWEIFFH
jgi:hypothetical protein